MIGRSAGTTIIIGGALALPLESANTITEFRAYAKVTLMPCSQQTN